MQQKVCRLDSAARGGERVKAKRDGGLGRDMDAKAEMLFGLNKRELREVDGEGKKEGRKGNEKPFSEAAGVGNLTHPSCQAPSGFR